MPRSGQPVTARVERTRSQILKAAGDCFAEHGFARATVAAIAERAGCSKALVYVYFDGKETLLRRVLERTLREWSEHNWDAVAREAPSSALDGLAVMHRASIDFARRHPVLRTILIRDQRLLLADDDETLRVATERWRRRLEELLARGVESGEVRSDLDLTTAADVVRLWHLSFLDRIYTESLIDTTNQHLVESSLAVLRRGLAARPAAIKSKAIGTKAIRTRSAPAAGRPATRSSSRPIGRTPGRRPQPA